MSAPKSNSAAGKKSNASYYPQLDSLRALAVAGVAWHHWMPQYTYGLPFDAGVQLFFVLSGFLITGILLDARDKHEQFQREPTSHILKSFYARRALRIFPLYYLVLSFATLLNISHLRENFAWHYLYASNFYFIYNQGWDGQISHFWTLAVEEQFYLLWPFVVLLTPRRFLPALLALFAASGPVYRLVGALAYPDVQLWDFATVGSFDSLAIGALLAYAQRRANPAWQWFAKGRWPIAAAALAGYASIVIVDAPRAVGSVKLTLLSLVFAVMIVAAAEGARGAIGAILLNRQLRYLGAISYGLYVLHNFAIIPVVLTYRFIPALEPLPGSRLVLLTFFTIAGAAISWRYIENPINRLKKRFPYNARAKSETTDAAATDVAEAV